MELIRTVVFLGFFCVVGLRYRPILILPLFAFPVGTVFTWTRRRIIGDPLQKPGPAEHRTPPKARGRARQLQAETTSLPRRTAATSSACSEATS